MLLQKAKQNTAKTASVPAPIGGWNGRDSLANMSPTDAVQMVNFFPTPTDVTMRKGWTQVSILTTTTGVKTISSITYANTGSSFVATLTTSSAHGLTTGEQVDITGCTPSLYNGIYTITVVNSTKFTYTLASDPTTNATVIGT